MYPIYTYPILTVVLPIVFRSVNRKLTWLSLIFAVIIELIMYWDEFCYYEAIGLMIYFTLIQVVVMSVICILLNLIKKNK